MITRTQPAWVACILFLSLVLSARVSLAEDSRSIQQLDSDSKYIAEIELHSVEEVQDIIDRAKHLHGEMERYSVFKPIALVLHGAEANVFLRKNYQQYQGLVDDAARLDAFNIIDIKVCEDWMRKNAVDKSELPPFIETVPYGVKEKQRLKSEGYQSF